MPDYLKEAFPFRGNWLRSLGATAAPALIPAATVFLPLVAAAEVAYLTGLVSIPRFRAAIDAKVHASSTSAPGTDRDPALSRASLIAILQDLPPALRSRFERLHARCLEMRR